MSNWRRLFRTGVFLAAAAVLCLSLFSCKLPEAPPSTVQVIRIIDGDTIEIAGGERVRYIGIDTPELSPEEPYAGEAKAANRELVEGKMIRLEMDTSEADRYGRLLRYVWVDEVMVNLELVRRGLAEAKEYPPDIRYQDLLEAAEIEARLAGRGMWGDAISK